MPLAIQPQDFYQRNTTASRTEWSLGTMRYVVKALAGRQAVVVVDTAVGSSVVGKLVRVFDGGAGRGPRLTIETEYAPGEFQKTNYWLPKVGVVIEMETLGQSMATAKFDALKMVYEDTSTALKYVRAQFDQEYAWSGKWTTKPSGAYDEIVVTRDDKGEHGYEFWRVNIDRITPMVKTV